MCTFWAQATVFSSARILNFLKAKGMDPELFMFRLVTVSLLQKLFKVSPPLMFFVLSLEDLVGKMPTIGNQLSAILIIGRQ
jgi:hypothetical protein